MAINSYRNLHAWQLGLQFAEDIYRVTGMFPHKELHALASQLQQAAVSIPSNLADGHARSSTKDNLHSISLATGSLAVLETQIELSARLEYIDKKTLEGLFATADELRRALEELRKTLQSKLEHPPGL